MRFCKNLMLAAVAASVLFNCQMADVIHNKEGDAVSEEPLMSGLSDDYTKITMEDYKQAFYAAIAKSPLAKSSASKKELPLSISELGAIYKNLTVKMPDFQNLSEVELQKVESELGMTRQEMVKDQVAVLEKYNAKIRYFLFKDVLKHLDGKGKTGSLKKQSFSYPYQEAYGLCDDEYWLLLGSPTYIDGTQSASNNAFAWEVEFYGNNGHMTQGDAFRHTIWNVLLAHYNKHEGPHRQDAVEWAEEFASAHESCRENSIYLDTKMDLHNNKVGRDYWYSVSTNRGALSWWGWDTRWVESPPTADLKAAVKSKTDNATFSDTEMLWPAASGVVYIAPNTPLTTQLKVYDPNAMYHQNTGAYSYSCASSFCWNMYGQPSGFMVFGPYATDIPAGLRRVQFDVSAWTSYPGNKDLAEVQIFSASTGRILNQRVLRMGDIPNTHPNQNSISMHYTQTAGQSMEFRIKRFNDVDFVSYKVSVY